MKTQSMFMQRDNLINRSFKLYSEQSSAFIINYINKFCSVNFALGIIGHKITSALEKM